LGGRERDYVACTSRGKRGLPRNPTGEASRPLGKNKGGVFSRAGGGYHIAQRPGAEEKVKDVKKREGD